jgi:hypothetical protein
LKKEALSNRGSFGNNNGKESYEYTRMTIDLQVGSLQAPPLKLYHPHLGCGKALGQQKTRLPAPSQ